MSSRQRYIPGILGGMGPQATVDFMAKVVAQTDAACDQDHIRILLDHNPGVPNRHAAIAGDGVEVVAALVDMATTLERAGADFLLMVCNTAHAYQSEIKEAVSLPFVSIVEEVVAELDACWPNLQRIGVMAAQGCIEAELYQKALLEAGREPILWRPEELDQFMSIVYQIKAGEMQEKSRQQMEHLAQLLVARGAQALVAGCTEIPLVLCAEGAVIELPVPLLSSTDILVSRTIDFALGKRDLPNH